MWQGSGTGGHVVVVGSANEDLSLPVARLPQAGSTVLAGGLSTGPGGKGANQAVAAAQAGARTVFVGALGQDERGDRILENFTRQSVDTAHVRRVLEPTGLAVVVRDEAGQNVIVVAPGANMTLTPDVVEHALSDLTASDVVVLQCEIARPAIEEAIRRAASAGAMVLLNLAPPLDLDPVLLESLDLLIVNESEARALLPAQHDGEPVDLAREVRRIAGCATIVTLGDQGAVISSAEVAQHVPATPVSDVRDSTGAGDVYVGSLAAHLLAGDDILEAMRQASCRAAESVSTEGAQGPERLIAK